MATMAELLRQEQKNELLKDITWLPECVASAIRNNGRYIIIYAPHISEVKKDWALPEKYDYSVCEWARQQGFNVTHKYNSYGVKQIVITL